MKEARYSNPSGQEREGRRSFSLTNRREYKGKEVSLTTEESDTSENRMAFKGKKGGGTRIYI